MRNKLNQFISNLNGQFVEVSYRPAPYQCFDLVYAWVFALDIPKTTIQHGAASEIWTLANDLTRQYFDLIENKLETIPKTGDIAVWSKRYGKYGHTAIVIEATQTRMKVFEQNDPLGTNAHIQDRKYTNVLGFLRPKEIIIPSVPKWLETLLQERSLTIKDESDIRTIFDKAKEAETATAVNYEQTIEEFSEILRPLGAKLGNKTEKTKGLLSDAVTELLELRKKKAPKPKILIGGEELYYMQWHELVIGIIKKGGDKNDR